MKNVFKTTMIMLTLIGLSFNGYSQMPTWETPMIYSSTATDLRGPFFNDLNNDGYIDILVHYHAQGKLGVFLNNGNGTFTDKGTFSMEKAGWPPIFADFNKDGFSDIAFANSDAGLVYGGPYDKVSVLLGNGDGTFQAYQSYTLNTWSYAIDAGDVNNDGVIDITVAFGGSGGFMTLTNDGDGTFTSGNYYDSNNEVYPMNLVDIDGDSNLDAVIKSAWSSSIEVFTGNGDGTFGIGTTYNGITGGLTWPDSNKSYDIDCDGDNDIYINENNNAYIMKNDGTGTLNKELFLTGYYFSDIIYYNADTYPDLIVVESGTQNYWLFLNDGNGMFTVRIQLTDWESRFADINNDGILEAIKVNSDTESLEIYFEKKDIIFTEINQCFLPNLTESAIDVGDIDNDGDMDVIISGYISWNNYITKVYLNDGFGNYSDSGIDLIGVKAATLNLVDIDQDGDLDIFLSGTYSDNINYTAKIYINNSGSFDDINNSTITSMADVDSEWIDFDNDGDLDLVLTGGNTNESATGIFKVYFNDGNTQFYDSNINIWNGTSLSGFRYTSVDAADFDNDGYKDILVNGCGYSNGEGGFWVPKVFSKLLKNQSGINLTEYTTFELLGNGEIVWNDYDNDGDYDLLITGTDDNVTGSINLRPSKLKVYKNNGGTFSSIAFELSGNQYQCSADWGDYNNDGYADILASYNNDNILRIVENKGSDNFELTSISNLTVPGYCQVRWCDVDNDGDLDIVTSNGKVFAQGMGNAVPVLSTSAISSITSNSAVSGGDVCSDGGATVSARGVCWSTSVNPTINDNTTSDGTGVGTFTSSLTGLSGSTTYYVRAYATNSAGTAYGNELSFKTLPASSFTVKFYPPTNWSNVGIYLWDLITYEQYEGGWPGIELISDEFGYYQYTVSGVANLPVGIVFNDMMTNNEQTVDLLADNDICWMYSDMADYYRWNVVETDCGNIVSAQNINSKKPTLFPNPTTRIVTFEFAENNIQKLIISDITGKKLIEKSEIQQNQQIDLSGFDNGIYIISIQTDKEIFTTKIVKE